MNKILTTLFCAIVVVSVQAQITLQVDTKKAVADIQPEMYGVFFEDINFGAG